MATDEIANVHRLHGVVAERQADGQIACVFGFDDKNSLHIVVFVCKNTKSFGFSTAMSVFFYNFVGKLRKSNEKSDYYADTETD